jgi:hypothetical protein
MPTLMPTFNLALYGLRRTVASALRSKRGHAIYRIDQHTPNCVER